MKLIVLTGSRGQLGRELSPLLLNAGYRVFALSHQDLDISDERAVKHFFSQYQIDGLINAAAYTKVDLAESHEFEAYAVNALGPRNLAAACAAAGIPMLHVSTDYVFGTACGRPHTEDDEPDPKCVYAKTKLAGEEFVLNSSCRALVVRSSWIFGRFGGNFVKTMLRLAQSRTEVSVVCDQIGNPTPARALAEALVRMLEYAFDPGFKHFGLYHFAGRPAAAWDELARSTFEQAGIMGLLKHKMAVRSIQSAAYPCPAVRPEDSRLNTSRCERMFKLAMPYWQDYLQETIKAFYDENSEL